MTVEPHQTEQTGPHEWRYMDWNSALCEHYFPPSAAGTPVMFLVDEEQLAEIHPSGDPVEAVRTLVSVVRPRLTPNHHQGTFYRFENEGRAWKVGDGSHGCPPFLPLLAICVLAASRMGAGALNPNNYRRPLCELLDLPSDRMPAGYGDSVPILWGYLHWWLEERQRGQRGRSTIVEDSRLTNIGFAISQTLFRAADHARLAEFFRWIDLQPGEEISGSELLAYFRAWAPSRGLSRGTQYMLASSEYAEGLQRILLSHAERWDGSRIPGTNERQGRITLVVRAFPRLSVGFAAPRPHGFPAPLELRDGRASLTLEAATEDWYSNLPLSPDADLLLNGIALTGDRLSLRFAGGPVHVLRLDERAGGWASVDQLRPGERHWVLVHERAWEEVQALLEAHAGPERREDQRITERLPGWHLVRDVVMERPPEGDVPASLRALVPTIRNRLSLEGGLPLARATDLYLHGGEPDLWLPPTDRDTALDVRIGDRVVTDGSARLRLAELDPPLDVGEHVIEVPGAFRRRFTTVESAVMLPNPAMAFGHRLSLSRDGEVIQHRSPEPRREEAEAVDVRVAGTLVEGGRAPDAGHRPAMVRRAARYAVVLGARPGERVGVPAAPPAPRWMAEWALSDRLYEHQPPFEAVWVIETWADAPRRRARRLADIPPSHDSSDTDAAAAWAEELLAQTLVLASDRQLWTAYVEAAREVLE